MAQANKKTTSNEKKRIDDLNAILKEAGELQEEYRGKPMPTEVAEKFESLQREAVEIQDEMERDGTIENLKTFLDAYEASKQVDSPTLPADGPSGVKSDDKVIGYITLGDAVVRSAAYLKALGNNDFNQPVPAVVLDAWQFETVTNEGVGYLPVTEKTMAAWRAIDTKNIEEKAVPTLTNVVEPQRLAGIVQQTPDDMLVLRDVMNIGRTMSNAVSWIRESTYTPVAVTVVETGATAKPEGAVTYTEQTSTVRTIAAWMPATVQQLADWPALRTLIDGRLLYDVRLREEEQIMYGDGTGTNFSGIFVDAGVAAITRGTANLVDRIRAGMTDILTASGQPTAAIVHPLDWESILFLKGTDGHYLGQVFPAAGRQSRLWSIPIVESVSCQARAGDATEEINLVVGDFRRACTLWMRSDASVMLGMINDDFTKNKRTILGEERAAFGIQTPAWLRKHQTVAAVP